MDLLRDICLEDEAAMEGLARVIGCILRGEVPQAATETLGRSRLIALLKGDTEAAGVRPIAVGEVLHRLTGRWLAHHSRGSMRSSLTPLQLGVGVSDGATHIVRAVQGLLDEHADWGLLQLDIVNAFNCVDRVAIFEELRDRGFASWIPFIRQYYADPSDLLFFGVEHPAVLQSSRGVRQGDPLGPFLFDLAFQRVLRAGSAALQDEGVTMAYQDDAALLGPAAALHRAFAAMVPVAASIGLTISTAKSRRFRVPLEGLDAGSLASVPAAEDGVEVLGCPVGTPAFVEEWQRQWLRDRLEGLEEVCSLGDPQAALLILRECFVTRPVYWLRLCPPTPQWLSVLRQFDEEIWRALQRLCLSPRDITLQGGGGSHGDSRRDLAADWAQAQAQLPISRGGLGLHSAAIVAPLSYVCASGRVVRELHQWFGRHFTDGHAAERLCPFWAESLALLPEAVMATFPSLQSHASVGQPDRLFRDRRSELERHQQGVLLQAMHTQGEQQQVQRMWGVRAPGAGSWITARPAGRGDRLYLAPVDAQLLLCAWLGLPVPQLDIPPSRLQHLGAEAGTADPYIPWRCIRSGADGRISTVHRAVQRELQSILRECSLRPVWEDSETIRGLRPDLTVTGMAEGAVTYAVDVVTADAQGRDAVAPGGAARAAEQEKVRKYADPLQALGGTVTLAAFAVETFGGLGSGAQDFIRAVAAHRLSRLSGDDEDLTLRLRHIFTQRIVLAMMRSQAHVLRRFSALHLSVPDWELQGDSARFSGGGLPQPVGFADIRGAALDSVEELHAV